MEHTDHNPCDVECEGLRQVREELSDYRTATDRRLLMADVTLATINTKVSWLVGICGAIGVAVLSAVLKLLIA